MMWKDNETKWQLKKKRIIGHIQYFIIQYTLYYMIILHQ